MQIRNGILAGLAATVGTVGTHDDEGGDGNHAGS